MLFFKFIYFSFFSYINNEKLKISTINQIKEVIFPNSSLRLCLVRRKFEENIEGKKKVNETIK